MASYAIITGASGGVGGVLACAFRAAGWSTVGIVNIASVHARATSAGTAVYAASKGGLVALTKGLAIELSTASG